MCRLNSFRDHNRCATARRAARRGLTLVELLLAAAVSAILVGALSTLSATVRQNSTFNQGQQDAVQHASVVFDRIAHYVDAAYATETYPGAVVVADLVGTTRYPDTLLIWRPATTPANPAGPPLVRELIIICPDPSDATQLVEITRPSDTRTIELNDASLNTSTGRTFVSGLKTAAGATKVLLTPLVRTASASATNGTTSMRAAVRFECELHPTAAEVSACRSGSTAWTNLNWPQGLYSSSAGMRQVWVRGEVQLIGKSRSADGTVAADAATLPFFGSATKYYTLPK